MEGPWRRCYYASQVQAAIMNLRCWENLLHYWCLERFGRLLHPTSCCSYSSLSPPCTVTFLIRLLEVCNVWCCIYWPCWTLPLTYREHRGHANNREHRGHANNGEHRGHANDIQRTQRPCQWHTENTETMPMTYREHRGHANDREHWGHASDIQRTQRPYQWHTENTEASISCAASEQMEWVLAFTCRCQKSVSTW